MGQIFLSAIHLKWTYNNHIVYEISVFLLIFSVKPFDPAFDGGVPCRSSLFLLYDTGSSNSYIN